VQFGDDIPSTILRYHGSSHCSPCARDKDVWSGISVKHLPFECFMGVLKHYVRNRARPEGSIIEGYVAKEFVEFCLDYMAHLDPLGVPRSIHEGKLIGVRTSEKVKFRPTSTEYSHAYLLAMHPHRHSVNKLHISHFNTWFTNQLRYVEAIDPRVATLTRGPTWEVRQF
jgi:hypothetical protein